MTRSVIDSIINGVIDREGGYADHLADRGGPTCWGITQAVARAFGYQGEMRALPRNTAFQILLERYWKQPKFDAVDALLPEVSVELLDTGVNMHPSVATKFLQRALNVLNQQGKLYPDLTVDGGVGKMTLYALERLIAFRGPAEASAVLLRMLNAQQSVRYMEIAEQNPSQEAFEHGWQRTRVA